MASLAPSCIATYCRYGSRGLSASCPRASAAVQASGDLFGCSVVLRFSRCCAGPALASTNSRAIATAGKTTVVRPNDEKCLAGMLHLESMLKSDFKCGGLIRHVHTTL